MNRSHLISETLSGYSSGGLQFTFEVKGLPADFFSVVRFDYQERYNELYELDVLLSAPISQKVALAELLDSAAALKIWRSGRLQQRISGMTIFAEQGDSGFHRTYYRIKLAPYLYRLSLRHNSRIFQLKDVREIISIILKEHKLPHFAFALEGDKHPKREFCVQYRETDLAFLQRLIGETGIFFYFEQEASGRETVVFCDRWEKLQVGAAPDLPYNPHQRSATESSHISTFKFAHQLRPHRVEFKDYSFKHPRWLANYQAEKRDYYEGLKAGYSHYDYPGRYKDKQGAYYAATRLDSLRRDANIGQGESNSLAVRVGQLFKLSAHPQGELNTYWQPIKIQCRGEQAQSLEEDAPFGRGQDGSYLTTVFDFIPRAQNYRGNFPQKPYISGPQTAVVVGPEGEEIFTDNYGRVKVQFHWDREGQHNDRSSCWIRVASDWAGAGWGMLSLPRIGQEVVVSFQEGDPDQPMITGRVYNALQQPPGHLPTSRTQMYIKSKTYRGKGYNSIMFDDATNDELFDMHAERDMAILVKHDQRNRIKNDRSLTVDGSQTTTIGRGRTTQITTGNELKTVLAGNDMETVSLLKSIIAKEIAQYAQDRIELEVGEQTSITLDNEKILLRFGQSTILMNGEGIWLDAVHIGMQEKDIELEENASLYEDKSIDLQYVDIYGNSPKGESILFASPKTGKQYSVQTDDTGKVNLEDIALNFFTATQINREDK
ncbi:type VI secretion system tip protein TssI/VgrG [Muribacter muris]|uniref:type VI secretion system tip protein TssI/VgrG n=1 Tax=Muribacter muris TaxID=67855 RepID=UPI00069D99CA|nr:type VI secretion system tip protein TssI/VgrG [Muribacter muris]